MTKRIAFFAAAIAVSLALAAPAFAQRDTIIAEARAGGLVGEQADGYLGFAPGAQISADLRGRVEQNNMRRRAAYAERAASASGATVAEIAAAVACEVFQERLSLGERYRDDQGVWRQFTATQPVAVPAVCG